MSRPDSQRWLASKADGDRAEVAVAEWFQSRGYSAFQTMGLQNFDLLLLAKVEVKHDRRATETGRIAVETHCNGKPSGISRTDATWWASVVGNRAILIKTDSLRKLVESGEFDSVKGGDGHKSVIVLVPIPKLIEAGAFVVPLTGVA